MRQGTQEREGSVRRTRLGGRDTVAKSEAFEGQEMEEGEEEG